MSQDKGYLVSKNNLKQDQNQSAKDNAAMPTATFKTPWQLFCSDVIQGYAASRTIEDEVAELFEGSYQLSMRPPNT